MQNLDILKKLAFLKPHECIHEEFYFGDFNGYTEGIENSLTQYSDPTIPSMHTRKKIPYCETSGCLAGELPGLTPDWYFTGNGNLTTDLFNIDLTGRGVTKTAIRLMKYFDLPKCDINFIFYPYCQRTNDPEHIGKSVPSVDYDLYARATLNEVQFNLINWLLHNNYITKEEIDNNIPTYKEWEYNILKEG